MSDRPDVAVVGAGILGLATARELLIRHPDLAVTVLDKEDRVAAHQTGHNSGVLHAGLYYAPGSLKARLCREGKAAMERFAEEHGIPVDRCGKLVVALDGSELGRFEDLRRRAEANGVEGLEVLGPEGMAEREPHAAGVRALWSPGTGIIDFGRVARVLADDVVGRGGTLQLGRPVERIERRGAEIVARHARRPGRWPPTSSPARGCTPTLWPTSWATTAASASCRSGATTTRWCGGSKSLVDGLIYPVPDPRFPFLGVHLTKRIDGEVLAGPNAVLAFAREGYRRRDVRPRELAGVLGEPGFRRLAARYWRTGATEMWRDISKRAFLRALQRYVPALRSEHLRFGPSGVRAQAVDPDGTLVDDFRLGGDDRALTVRNAPSPAATASLAIAGVLASRAEEQFAALGT